MRRLGLSLRDAWALARPYWTSSDERWKAWGMLALLVVLNLALVGINVVLTYWKRSFYNALQEKDVASFWHLMLTWDRAADGTIMPGFCALAAVFILIAVYQIYLRQALQIRWRRWLTAEYLNRWMADRAYYRIALTERGTDNPDQRIAEDVRSFVDNTLILGLDLMSSVVTLVSFITVLWSLSSGLLLFGVQVPGYLVWVALVYAVVGTWLTHLVGRRLIGLNFQQQKVEADFRFSLVRLRENAEGVALYGGERDEHRDLLGRFGALMSNFWSIMVATKRLNALTSGYDQAAVVFPYIVAAPAYFTGQMTLGGMMQVASVFSQVQSALSWFVSSYSSLASYRATVERLTSFDAALASAQRHAADGPQVAVAAAPELVLDNVSLGLPDGRQLLEGVSVRIGAGDSVVITGASGSGKSTLFRVLAGIWPFGRGTVRHPKGTALFLPQRPYLPLGTLRRAVCYPGDAASFSDAAIREALEAAGLGALADRLDEADSWERRLSGGEQQRMALARALLLQPDWLFLDEATASLDPAAEQALYRTLRERLPNATLVSIAHRPAVAGFHARRLDVSNGRLAETAAAAPA